LNLNNSSQSQTELNEWLTDLTSNGVFQKEVADAYDRFWKKDQIAGFYRVNGKLVRIGTGVPRKEPNKDHWRRFKKCK